MADVTAKLAKALRGLLADRIYAFDFKEAEKVLAEYDAALAATPAPAPQPVQDLPPLPIEWRKVEDAEGVEVPVFRAFQMRDYARAALAATPAPAPQPLTDEQKGNEWRLLLPLSERFTSADWFEAGACFAEQHHGIGQGAATPAPAEQVPVRVHQLLAALTTNDDAHARARFAIELRALYVAATPAPAPKPCLVTGDCKHGNWCSEVYCQEHCRFVGAATPAPAPAGYVAAEIYAAWRKVGADVCGLKWDAFIDALRAGQGKEAK